jgi:type VI secretion system protein ImpM
MFGSCVKNPASPTASARLRPGCFGKLPIHSDFIRYHLATREAGAFEKWVQEGAACIARSHPKGWPPVYRHFPVHHFVLSGREQEDSLIGSLVSSRDKSGRVYPFTTLATVGGAVFNTNRATLPLVHRDFYRESEGLIEIVPNLASVNALAGELDALAAETPPYQQRDLLEHQIRLLETIPLKSYWADLKVPVSERERFWCAFYDIMKSAQKRGPSRTHWGIRIPLPDAGDQTPFVIFWVQMVEAILEDRFWRAHYFWNKGTDVHNACLTLFFRPLPPSYLAPLINHKLDDNAVFDLGREWCRLTSFDSRVDLRRLLDNDDIPLLDMLYRTGRREMLR